MTQEMQVPQDEQLARQMMREAPGLCLDDALALARFRLYGPPELNPQR